MPSVVHICTDYWPNVGGMERFITDLATRQAADGWRASVLCLDRTAQHRRPLPRRDEHCGLPVRRVPYLDWKFYKPTLLPLEVLRGADVLHLHGLGGPSDAAAAASPLHGRPMVLSTHGGVFHTGRLAALKRVYVAVVRQTTLRRVRRVVACSRPDLVAFESLVRPDKLVLIENGVDLSPHPPGPPGPSRREANRFVFVGRLAENKRVELLLETFAALRRRGADARLRVVGIDSGGGDAARATAARLGFDPADTLVGGVDDAGLGDELRRASWFVSASRHEGFGISLVEAMAAGCAPVVQPIDAFRAIVDEGRTGYFADFENPEAAAGRLMSLLETGPGHVAGAARSAATRYDWSNVMPRWHALYHEVLASTRPAGRA